MIMGSLHCISSIVLAAQTAPFPLPRLDHEIQLALVLEYLKSRGAPRLSRDVVELLARETGGEAVFLDPVWEAVKEQGSLRQCTADMVKRAVEASIERPSRCLLELGVSMVLDSGLRGIIEELIAGRTPLLRQPVIDIDPFQLRGAVVVERTSGIQTYQFRNGIVREFLKRSFAAAKSVFPELKRKLITENSDLLDLLRAKQAIWMAETLWSCTAHLIRGWKITTEDQRHPRLHVTIRLPHQQPVWFEVTSAFGPEGESPRPDATDKAEALAAATRNPALGWDGDHVAFSILYRLDGLTGTVTATAMRRAGDFTDGSLSNWTQFIQSVAGALTRLALSEFGRQHLILNDALTPSFANGEKRPAQEKWHIFLSHSARDLEHAKWLNRMASKKGLKMYVAARELSGGDEFIEEIRHALLGSSELCVLITPQSLKSSWVFTEWGAAWALGKRITPILLQCSADQLPDRLKIRESVDFHKIGKYLGDVAKRLCELELERQPEIAVDHKLARKHSVGTP